MYINGIYIFLHDTDLSLLRSVKIVVSHTHTLVGPSIGIGAGTGADADAGTSCKGQRIRSAAEGCR